MIRVFWFDPGLPQILHAAATANRACLGRCGIGGVRPIDRRGPRNHDRRLDAGAGGLSQHHVGHGCSTGAPLAADQGGSRPTPPRPALNRRIGEVLHVRSTGQRGTRARLRARPCLDDSHGGDRDYLERTAVTGGTAWRSEATGIKQADY